MTRGMTKLAILCGEQNWRCAYCGERLLFSSAVSPEQATVDHLIPLGDGGAKEWQNEVAACWLCNNGRGDLNALVYFGIVLKHGRMEAPGIGARLRSRRDNVHASRRGNRRRTVVHIPYDKGATSRVSVQIGLDLLKSRGLLPEQPIRAPQIGVVRRGSGTKKQRDLVGHSVQPGEFGSRKDRLPKCSTPAAPIEGATLRSIWPGEVRSP